MNQESRKIIANFLLFSVIGISLSPLFTRKAEAQWVVYDPANFAVNAMTAANTTANTWGKEFGLDTIAFIIINMIIERVAASTVNWINSGFQGSPAFVTNPEAYFKKIGDQVAGQLIFNHPDTRFMCAPFKARVQIALSQAYLNPFGNFQCSLSRVVRNFDNFMNDFSDGGWEGFIELTQNSQNNPLGSFNQRMNQINLSVGNSLGQANKELDWGKGFLSFRKPCTKLNEFESREFLTDEQYDALPCLDSPPIETPGSVVESQLNQTLQIGNSRLQVADEINEIISALLNQLVGKALGGLLSLGKPDPSNANSQSYLEQLQTATENNDADPYYNTSNNNRIRDLSTNIENQTTNLGNSLDSAEDIGNSVFGGNYVPPPDTSGFGAGTGETGGNGGSGNTVTLPDGTVVNCASPQTEPGLAACISAGKI
ncbi:MAG TPA: hypothetical protein VJH67_02090 [Candidatus Paceibacterota bacterium]